MLEAKDLRFVWLDLWKADIAVTEIYNKSDY